MTGYYSITLVVSASVNQSVGTSMHPYFQFSENNLSKYQWIFTKLVMCTDIVQSLFGIANGHFHQFLTNLSVCKMSVYSFLDDNLRKYQLIFTNLVCALILWKFGLGWLMSKFSQFLTKLSGRNTSDFVSGQ